MDGKQIRQAVRVAVGNAAIMGRAVVKTGLARDISARGALLYARQRLAGSVGPATLHRIHAANHPDKLALIFGRDRWTYRELDDRIDRLAAGLRDKHGIKPGDAAILVMHNRPEFLEIQSAMARLGGAAVTVSWRSTPAELTYLVEHSGARAIFAEVEVSDGVASARPELTSVPEGNVFAIAGSRAGFLPYEAIAGTTGLTGPDNTEGSVVIYTSGTTGKPKGAVRKFPKEAAAAVMAFMIETPIATDDRHLAVCPMYHSTAFGFIAMTFVVGGTVVIDRGFEPERFLATVARERITTTAVVPTMLHRLLELPRETIRRYDTSSLRAVFSGGAPLSGALARRFIDTFGPVLFNFYGATETGLNTIATSDELVLAPGTIGHMVPGNEIRLLDDAGHDVPAGKTGELWVRNQMLVAGYHRDADATEQAMRDGFFSVGDLGHVDRHGLYHLDGRKRDMIITGGVNVYPAEVEETLHQHPAIGEAAVIGVPDAEWGERVCACVVPRSGWALTPEEVTAFCKSRLSGPKVPREVVLYSELPKNPTGKVLKRELRAQRSAAR